MLQQPGNKCTLNIPSIPELMDRVQSLISRVWNIGHVYHQPRIDKWLSNFTGEALKEYYNDQKIAKNRETQLALFLLCNYVYYNEIEIKHLVKEMFFNYVHHTFVKGQEKKESIVASDDLRNLIKRTQFTYMGEASESSSYLLYHFRQENELSRQCFRENKEAENIVFIDDFSLTGSQASTYLNKIQKTPDWDHKKSIYILLMIASKEAINKINKKINNLTILPCIMLDDKSKAFSDDSVVFANYNINDKQQACQMCIHYGKKIIGKEKGMAELGFLNSGYLFGAYYNIPNNTLPIFWSTQNNWINLFKRYEKKYDTGLPTFGGRYV